MSILQRLFTIEHLFWEGIGLVGSGEDGFRSVVAGWESEDGRFMLTTEFDYALSGLDYGFAVRDGSRSGAGLGVLPLSGCAFISY